MLITGSIWTNQSSRFNTPMTQQGISPSTTLCFHYYVTGDRTSQNFRQGPKLTVRTVSRHTKNVGRLGTLFWKTSGLSPNIIWIVHSICLNAPTSVLLFNRIENHACNYLFLKAPDICLVTLPIQSSMIGFKLRFPRLHNLDCLFHKPPMKGKL